MSSSSTLASESVTVPRLTATHLTTGFREWFARIRAPLFFALAALLVYVGMLAALMLAFVAGRLLPISLLAKFFKRLGFERAHGFILGIQPLSRRERLALLTQMAPSRMVPLLARHRYLLLMLILNLPGNSLVGGGGGIAFVAGLSRLFSAAGFIAAIVIAVAPIPLFFYLTS